MNCKLTRISLHTFSESYLFELEKLKGGQNELGVFKVRDRKEWESYQYIKAPFNLGRGPVKGGEGPNYVREEARSILQKFRDYVLKYSDCQVFCIYLMAKLNGHPFRHPEQIIAPVIQRLVIKPIMGVVGGIPMSIFRGVQRRFRVLEYLDKQEDPNYLKQLCKSDPRAAFKGDGKSTILRNLINKGGFDANVDGNGDVVLLIKSGSGWTMTVPINRRTKLVVAVLLGGRVI
ncbi:hypothetical protein BDZ91DRAFT_761791 [Kalaharituber pfeilii]|nr:hypothetical protein BDZ91DRAFT_761791 [Kalaharituber pfeilii]